MSSLQIELRPLASLKPNPRNPRVHSRRQIEQIADSIRTFGFTNPVLIDDRDTILASHGRVAAAKLLGEASVPTIRLSAMTEAEKRAYLLADNKLALSADRWSRLSPNGRIRLPWSIVNRPAAPGKGKCSAGGFLALSYGQRTS